MSFIEQHDARVNSIFGDKKIHLKIFGNKRMNFPKFDLPILFGVELEYEVANDGSARTAREEAGRLYRAQIAERLEPSYQDFAICKHDGSMQNGIEIVSIPMSLDAHREQWRPFFAIAEDNGLAVRATCGMHVHISREHLTPLHIGKILAFIHNKDNALLIKLIAGRSRPVYTGQPGHYTDIPLRKISDVNRNLDRYSALNIRGAETIEFRFFKSTLDLTRMIANIEFCDALMRMTWPSCASIQEIKDNGIKLFSNFVLENRKAFPYLFDFLKKEGYIKWTKKIPLKYQPKKPEVVISAKTKSAAKPARRSRALVRRVPRRVDYHDVFVEN